MSNEPQGTERSMRRHMVAGVGTIILLAGGIGGWAATTELSGAVVTSGLLVVDLNVKKVQHPTGGVVGELRVRDGQRVKIDDIVIRLDETITRANLAIITKSLDELAVRQARLEAERDGSDAISFPNEVLARAGNSDVDRVVSGERKLFDFRRTARAGQKAQLKERIAQLQQEAEGLVQQIVAEGREIDLIQNELVGIRELWAKNLIPISRLTAMEREAVRLDGDRGQLAASVAQGKGKMAEIELQIMQIEQDLRTEVAKELREFQAKTAEYVERKVAAEDQLKRIDIRAPLDGVVHQLAVHTVGGVISGGESLMLIVPDSDELTVEARVAPQDIDQIVSGQSAVLRFAAFNQGTTPEIMGVVSRVSADVSHNSRTGATHYVARVAMPAKEVARLKGLKLVPGMPVEVFIQTNERSVFSYLVKPMHDQIFKAFRER